MPRYAGAVRFLVIVVVAAAACGRGDKSPPPTTPPAVATDATATRHPGSLSAPTNVSSSRDLKVQLTVTNPGPADLTLTRGALELPMLALEVRDAAGKRVNPLPPPVPRPEDATTVTLRPGETQVRDYLLTMFSPELPAATYTLHCLVVTCEPVSFNVTAPE